METIFVKTMRNGELCFFEYKGMSKESITKTLVNLGCSDVAFISEEENAALVKQQIDSRKESKDSAKQKNSQIYSIVGDKSRSIEERFEASMILLGINKEV